MLMLSAFMSWYAGTSIEGPTLAVIGWHTGAIGKIVFFIGLLLIAFRPARRMARSTAVDIASMYWHAMDAIWIFLFLFLMIGGRA